MEWDRLTRTHFWPETIDFLRKLSLTLPKDSVLVNIGAYWESSTISILYDRPDLYAFSIDPEVCEDGLDNLKHFGLQDRVVRVLGRSQDVGRYWRFPIGMAYIDGDHSYIATITDGRLWIPHVVPGGLVAFHDYGTKHTPGVVQAVDELMGDYECLGFDREPERGGVLKVYRV
jgi:predicted O-methyltransferase YrrM